MLWGSKRWYAVGLMLIVSPVAQAAIPTLVTHPDRLEYRSSDGKTTEIRIEGAFSSAVLSPDGRSIAYIRVLKPETPDRDGEAELWLADGPSVAKHRLMASRSSPQPERNLSWYDGPVFSADGKFIYVTAIAWGDEMAVHRIDVASGNEKFVVSGELLSVLRNGPYRGSLLVKRHTAWPAPQLGAHYPVYLVGPNGRIRFRIPNMDHDDNDAHVTEWLSKHGWTAR